MENAEEERQRLRKETQHTFLETRKQTTTISTVTASTNHQEEEEDLNQEEPIPEGIVFLEPLEEQIREKNKLRDVYEEVVDEDVPMDVDVDEVVKEDLVEKEEEIDKVSGDLDEERRRRGWCC